MRRHNLVIAAALVCWWLRSVIPPRTGRMGRGLTASPKTYSGQTANENGGSGEPPLLFDFTSKVGIGLPPWTPSPLPYSVLIDCDLLCAL